MYATTFKNLSLDKKAKLLCDFLKIKPTDEASFKGYKQVLSFMIGGILISPKPRYASANYILGVESEKINEHTIPINLVTDYFISLEQNYTNETYIKNCLEKLCGIALISKLEDDILNQKLKTTLPPGISISDIIAGKAKHSCRYDYVGLNYMELKDYEN